MRSQTKSYSLQFARASLVESTNKKISSVEHVAHSKRKSEVVCMVKVENTGEKNWRRFKRSRI